MAFTVAMVALSVLMTWIYLRGSRSLAPMVVTHFAFNTGLGIAGPDGLGLAATLPLLEGTAVLPAAAAAAVWVLGRRGRPARTSERRHDATRAPAVQDRYGGAPTREAEG